jgi:HIRAN domain
MPFPGNKRFDVKVVGESFYQENLFRLCGPAASTMRQFPKRAVLALETNNPRDKNAVRVDIDGLTVGHLSREDAVWFREMCGAPNGSCLACDAVIIALRGNARPDYGVRLDVDVDSFNGR